MWLKKLIYPLYKVAVMSDILLDWITVHVKNRDLLHRAIRSIESAPGYDLVVRRDDEDQYFIVMPELGGVDGIVYKAAGRKLGIVTFNTEKNVLFLIKNWDALRVVPKLCFYFVNPASNDRWILYPKTHDLITDSSALKPGLLSLFQGIPAYEP